MRRVVHQAGPWPSTNIHVRMPIVDAKFSALINAALIGSTSEPNARNIRIVVVRISTRHHRQLREEAVDKGGILVGSDDLFATVVSGVLVIVLAIFFQKTRIGRALRAVADDHQAAQSIGIPLNRIWADRVDVAGIVALVAGVIWGSRLGVQFSCR